MMHAYVAEPSFSFSRFQKVSKAEHQGRRRGLSARWDDSLAHASRAIYASQRCRLYLTGGT